MKLRRAGGLDATAICFNGGRVRLARIDRAGDKKPLLSLCKSLVGDSTAETLTRLRREYELAGSACVTLLGEGDYQLQMMEAPNVPEAELRSAVRWRLKDVLDYPPDAATVDVVRIPASPNAPSRSGSVYAVAARNELIAETMAKFSDARLTLKAIDIPEMAQRNIACLYEVPQRALAMLSMNEHHGLLTLSAAGELYLARSFDVGAAQLQRAEGELRAQLFERVVLEIQRSLDYFDRQVSRIPVGKLVLAPLPEGIELQERLSANLDVEVEQARLQDHIDISTEPELASPELQADQFLTIGAALREETVT